MVDAGIMGQIAAQVPWNLVLHKIMVFESLVLAKTYMSVLTCYLFFCTALSSFTCIRAGWLVRVRTTLLTQTRILRAPACLSSES